MSLEESQNLKNVEEDTTRLLNKECENFILFKLSNFKKIKGLDIISKPSKKATNPWGAQLFLILLFSNVILQFFNIFSSVMLNQVLLKKN